MEAEIIKKQVDRYLPLLSNKQQTLVLEMIKGFLNITPEIERISKKHYNQEINDAVARLDKGEGVPQKDVEKELAAWYREKATSAFGTGKR